MPTARPGLFLDLDGTLADSLSVMKTVYERFLQHFGKLATPEEFNRLNGPPLTTVVALIAEWHELSDPLPSLIERYWAMIDAAYAEVAPNPGAELLLQTAAGHGWPVCIVTSNKAALARHWLEACKLSGYVTDIVGGEHVTQGKPAPEPYLLALDKTGCTAAASFAIEDSPAGVSAAVAAQIRTFMLTDTPPSPGLRAEPIERLDMICSHIVAGGRAAR